MEESTAGDPLIEYSDAEFRAKYDVLHSIGAGGGGEVFLATQRSLSRRVVCKVIQRSLVADETHMRRFQREARMLSQVSHARITQLYEYGVWAGSPFLVMEYVEGGSLAQLMELSGPMEPREALRIAMEVAEGLDHLHARKMLHRDIKPGNILLTLKREVKIADFGLARPDGEQALTGEGLVVGTLWYLAPELLTSADASPGSDLYSLGMVTYQMLCGRMAFREDVSDMVQLAALRVNEPPIPLQHHNAKLPPEVCTLVNRMIAQDPGARPDKAGEVVRQLAELHDRLSTPSMRLKRPPLEADAAGTAQLPVEEVRAEHLSQTRRGERDGRNGDAHEADGRTTDRRPRLSGSRSRRFTRRMNAPMRAGIAMALTAVVIAGLAAGWRLHRKPPPPAVDEDGVERVSQLVIERFPAWVRARMTTVAPGKLVLRVVPAGGGQGQVLEAESKDLHEHDVSVEPLDPRTNYDVQARLKLADGREQAVGSQLALSPLSEMLRLARDVEQSDLPHQLFVLDTARKMGEEPTVERVMALVERYQWMARLKKLADYPTHVYADPGLMPDELVALYRGFQGVRLLDHYAQAHGLAMATGVEKLMSPELTSGPDPIAAAPAVEAQLEEKRMLLPTDASSTMLMDLSESISSANPLTVKGTAQVMGTLDIPPGLDGKRMGQVRFRVTNVRAWQFVVAIENFPVELTFVPSFDHALKGDTVDLYHTVPARWLTAGKHTVKITGGAVPCSDNNRVKQMTMKFGERERNFPRIDGVAVLVR